MNELASIVECGNAKRFGVRLRYRRDAIDVFRSVEGRRWQPEEKMWTFPSSAKDVLRGELSKIGVRLEGAVVAASLPSVGVEHASSLRSTSVPAKISSSSSSSSSSSHPFSPASTRPSMVEIQLPRPPLLPVHLLNLTARLKERLKPFQLVVCSPEVLARLNHDSRHRYARLFFPIEWIAYAERRIPRAVDDC